MVKAKKNTARKTKSSKKKTKKQAKDYVPKRGKGEVIRVSNCDRLIKTFHSSALDCELSNKDIPISFRAENTVMDRFATEITKLSKLLVIRACNNRLQMNQKRIEEENKKKGY